MCILAKNGKNGKNDKNDQNSRKMTPGAPKMPLGRTPQPPRTPNALELASLCHRYGKVEKALFWGEKAFEAQNETFLLPSGFPPPGAPLRPPARPKTLKNGPRTPKYPPRFCYRDENRKKSRLPGQNGSGVPCEYGTLRKHACAEGRVRGPRSFSKSTAGSLPRGPGRKTPQHGGVL